MDIIKKEKWQEKLELIAQSLFFLKANQFLFQEIKKILDANPALRNDHYVIGWIRQNYYSSAAMGYADKLMTITTAFLW